MNRRLLGGQKIMIKRIVHAILPRPVRSAIWRARTATGRVSAGAVRRVLMSNERLFLWTYNRVSRPPSPSRARVPCRFQQTEEQQIEAIVSELRQNGMAIWRGLFADPVFLNEARSTLDEDFSRWEKIFRERDDTCEEIFDEESRCRFYRGTKKKFEIDKRIRVLYSHHHLPLPIQKMKGDLRLREVVCRYYQLDAGECHYIRDSSLISTCVQMIHSQRTSDEKRPGRGRQSINPKEFATTGPRTPETAANYLLHRGLRQDGGGDQRGVSIIQRDCDNLRVWQNGRIQPKEDTVLSHPCRGYVTRLLAHCAAEARACLSVNPPPLAISKPPVILAKGLHMLEEECERFLVQ